VRRSLVIFVSFGLAVAGLSSAVGAQETTDLAPVTHVRTHGKQVVNLEQTSTGTLSASDGNAAALGTGAAEAAPGSVTHGDTSGIALLGPDGTYSVNESSPPSISVSDTPPVYEPAPEPVVAEPVSDVPVEEAPVQDVVVDDTTMLETAPASGDDLDGDNLADSLEGDLGLDPTLIDTDGDGVADGDEINLYGTDPTVFDSDGDGMGDGDELYNLRTDPLAWDTDGNGAADGADSQALSSESTDENVVQ
jgi:hypothetical protein